MIHQFYPIVIYNAAGGAVVTTVASLVNVRPTSVATELANAIEWILANDSDT